MRWIAPDPHRAERLLVGIELGGVMRTDDGGATFSDHRPGAKLDAHQLAWHPLAPDRAYQAAGDGAAWTRDGGETWDAADTGRDRGYCWALAVDPGDPDRWYVSAASGPERRTPAVSGPRAPVPLGGRPLAATRAPRRDDALRPRGDERRPARRDVRRARPAQRRPRRAVRGHRRAGRIDLGHGGAALTAPLAKTARIRLV